MYPCETKWLEQAMKYITNTQTIMVRITLWHPCDGQWWRINSKLGHPWWCSYAQWWHPTESELLPLLHSGTLIWLLCPTGLIACTSSSWVWMNHQYTNAYYLRWSPCVCCQTCFLSFPRWVCQMGGITCVHTMTCMFPNSLACDQHHFSPCLLHANCWDGSITFVGTISFSCACCAPLLYLFVQPILSSLQLMLFLELPLQNMQLFLYFSLFLHVIFMSHFHLIA